MRHYSSAIDRARALEDHERHDPGDRTVTADLCCAGCCSTPATAGTGRPIVATHTLDRTEAGNDYWKCGCGAVTIRATRGRAVVLPITGEGGEVEAAVIDAAAHDRNVEPIADDVRVSVQGDSQRAPLQPESHEVAP